jgi:antitoxin MazE
VRRSIIEAFGFERNNGTSREHLRRLRRFRGRLPADFRFDRLEANERR